MMLVIFGAGGMLGEAVCKEAERQCLHYLPLAHVDCDITDVDQVKAVARLGDPSDVWVNCAGVLRADQYGYLPKSDLEMVQVNAWGPFNLAYAGAHPLILISTDSVFSGKNRGYPSVTDRPDPADLYGLSKLIGEQARGVRNHILVLRTSFMGPRYGLWKMALDKIHNLEPVPTHPYSWWSGSTVGAVARAIIKISQGPLWPSIIEHLASRPITKARVLEYIVSDAGLAGFFEMMGAPAVYRALFPTIPLEEFPDALLRDRA